MPPNNEQLALLALSTAMFIIGGVISMARLRRERSGLRVTAQVCMYAGLIAAVGVLAWHSAQRRQWAPINNNFDALLWLAVLLTLFVVYTQSVRPVAGLDWFLMPIVILLLVAAGVFGRLEYRQYKTIGKDTWVWVHDVSGYAGAVAFAVAAGAGAMFVLVRRRLRRKTPLPALGNLERVESMMMAAVTLGFALLTISLITGFILIHGEKATSPRVKMLLASLAWLVYAIVMHAPINPRFRGRRAALLSVLGFALVIGTLVAVQLMPAGGG